MNKLVVRAPAKLILSGEHAVLYGAPALAIAVDSYSYTEISYNKINKIFFDLEQPSKLAEYTANYLFNKLNLKFSELSILSKGLDIKIDSDIPIGSGMGSSAAIILSILYSIGNLFKLNLSHEDYYELGLACENFQHGKSSGLDLKLVLNGGCIYFENQNITKRNIHDISMELFKLVNTGIPESSTKQCVDHARKYFKNNHSLVADFTEITKNLDYELNKDIKNIDNIKKIIRENNKLLNNIGVVSEKTQNFIKKIEQAGGAAKICGAGTVIGDASGVVLVINDEDNNNFSDLVKSYNYTQKNIKGVQDGITVI